MTLDKYSKLKIAGNVLDFTIREFAEEHGTSTQVIRDVCLDNTTSARLSKAIDEKIAEAEHVYDKLRKSKSVNPSHSPRKVATTN